MAEVKAVNISQLSLPQLDQVKTQLDEVRGTVWLPGIRVLTLSEKDFHLIPTIPHARPVRDYCIYSTLRDTMGVHNMTNLLQKKSLACFFFPP